MTLLSTFIIAEAGVNHNGERARAVAMVKAAAEAGADAIKFQSFKAEKIATALASKANYQARNTGASGGQIEMLKALELSDDDFQHLFGVCQDAGIEFISTPFDVDSGGFLANTIGGRRLKIASGEITNAPLLLDMARTGLPIILSTGMSAFDDIEAALGILAFGYTLVSEAPSLGQFKKSFLSDSGQAALRSNVTILHCTSEYPAPPETINLRAMTALAKKFNLPVGISDHSAGIVVATAAAGLGACVIEKHFTLDNSLSGPDHRASLKPAELTEMILAIRTVERALGSDKKAPVESEIETRKVARRSLVSLRPIAKGEVFNSTNLGAKRPGTGVSPLSYWSYIGRRATRDYTPDELIDSHD